MKYAKKEVLLSVKDVSLKLGGKQILHDINFEIRNTVRPDMIQGQIVALIGASGAGKSTLFSLMAGLRQPDTGSILVHEPTTDPYHPTGYFEKPVCIGDMGIVYQNYFVYGWRKVKDILAMARAKNKNPVQTVAEIATDFRLTDHLNKYPKELSGGQVQRVAIAEQILTGSEFLLLDEPFSGLDVLTIDKVIDMLVRTSNIDELKTLVVVSHDLRNAIAIADTVYVLAKQPDKEGGTIVKTIDLIERDLAWHPDIKEMPEFKSVLDEVKSLL